MKKFSRRGMVQLAAASVGAACVFPSGALAQAETWWKATPAMDAMTAIRTRRSVRSYTSEGVGDDLVDEILGAAMSAPSAGNEQPWEFVVIRDRQLLAQAGKINKYAGFAKSAPVAILVCGDLNRDKYGGYWIEDVSAAMQNMLLAAHALGLGAVWTGIYPLEDRVAGFRKLVGAPENIVPMGLAVIGRPKETPAPVDRFQRELVHLNGWG